MKKIISTLILILILPQSHALNSQVMGICDNIYKIGEMIIDQRYNGVTYKTSLSNCLAIKHKGMQTVCSSMTQIAYEKPSYISEDYIARAKTDYLNQIYAECLAAYIN